MDRAAYGTLESTYTNLKTVMEEVEGAKEENISKYSSSLEAGGWDQLCEGLGSHTWWGGLEGSHGV